MPEEDYDLAGFAVGVCDKKEMITGEQLKAGDVLIGMASTGVHSNGFSLVRKVFEKEMTREGLNTYYDELGKTLGEALLAPTRIYVKALKSIKKAGVTVKACSHITGGGFYENVPRMLKEGTRAVIKKDSYEIPAIFGMLAKKGDVAEEMMYNTFNMGLGMIVAVDPADADKAMEAIRAAGDTPYVIGSIEEGEKELPYVKGRCDGFRRRDKFTGDSGRRRCREDKKCFHRGGRKQQSRRLRAGAGEKPRNPGGLPVPEGL